MIITDEINDGATKIIISVDESNIQAVYGVGLMYENGIKVDKDNEKAVVMIHKAAVRNFFPAQNNLGKRYEQGIGLKKNKDKAVGWYKKAAKGGCIDSQIRLDLIKKYGFGNEENDIVSKRKKNLENSCNNGCRVMNSLRQLIGIYKNKF